ncbi:alpha/beta fold hydrolase [Roseobacter sp. S98]|uniref:alpha/beta fold hydrolase n=1 Tax=Roseobacter algicola (ex Choi et al. 2025) (nom. illeg.) TaxID=3092138 RepID=UPI003F51009A
MTADPDARVWGSGPAPALAIHCTLGHSGMWRGVGQYLAASTTLTAFDLPGHGRAPDWDGTDDLHRACCDAAQPFLDQPVHLIGHSFGATVALRLAIEHPDQVRSLTLVEPVFFAALPEAEPELADHLAEAAPYIAALNERDYALAARLFNRLWGDGTRWPDIPETARQYMSDRMYLVPGQSPAIFDDNAGLMRPGVLERASMPVLLMRGDQSPEITRHINAALARRLPAATLCTVAGAGHMAPLTHASEVARVVRSLIEVAEEGVDLRSGD